jgi:hypothetical protein
MLQDDVEWMIRRTTGFLDHLLILILYLRRSGQREVLEVLNRYLRFKL